MEHLEKFLLELGQGFAFVGRQVHLEFSDEDYYIDLLFYHIKLRCFVVVELKSGKFDPGSAHHLLLAMARNRDILQEFQLPSPAGSTESVQNENPRHFGHLSGRTGLCLVKPPQGAASHGGGDEAGNEGIRQMRRTGGGGQSRR